MKRKQMKFVVGSVVIVLALGFVAFTGFQDNKSYYQTVPELFASKDAAYGRNLRIEGDVVPDSIKQEGTKVNFVISGTDKTTKQMSTLKVRYVGTDPLPDTFRDYAQAVVEGKYGTDGVFVAQAMQAKCASKYEKEQAAGITPTQTGK